MLNNLLISLISRRLRSRLFFTFLMLGFSGIALGQGSVATSFMYTPSNVTLSSGSMMTPMQPWASPGSATLSNFTVSPSLPATLTLNQNTGAITGMPSGTQSQTSYVVSATNTSSQTLTTTIQITINSSGGSSSSTVATSFSYTPLTLTDNTLIMTPMAPYISPMGATLSGFISTPSLPAGLTFSGSGAITGTPSGTQSQTSYVVSATNASSQTLTATIQITINASGGTSSSTVATSFNYMPLALYAGSAIFTPTPPSITPMGATLTNFISNPSLPNGLTLNSFGAITGTPTSTQSQTSYSISAVNSSNQTVTTTLSITVDASPVASSYTYMPLSLTVGTMVMSVVPPSIMPMGASLTNFTASPSLPTGLTFNSFGAITGTPSATQSQTSYTISAVNSSNQTITTTLQITVDASPVATSFTYMPLSLTSGTMIMAPTQPSIMPYNATLSNYTSSPSLPAGLTFNSFGAITGTPSVTQSQTSYTVSAVNSSNQTVTTTLSITINSSGGGSSSTVATSFMYTPSSITLTAGSPNIMYATPPSITPMGATLTGFMSTPTLPAGLSLNSFGVITGTPSMTQSQTSYVISATNASSQTLTTTIQITISAGGGSSSSTTTYYSIASGSWSATSTWSLTSNGAPISTGYPGMGDNVIIEGGKTVTISNSSATVSGITIKNGSILSVLTGNVSTISGIVVNPGGALIGSSTNVTGTVRLQQNIVGQRGWRLFANPFSTPQNIPSIAISNGITIGTSISGNITSTDLKTFSGTWTNVTTTSLMPTVEEYALFIRGLASEVTGSSYTGGPSAFTYNVSGSINSASLSRSQSSGVFRIIGNPYAAPVNSSALTAQTTNVPYYTYKISATGNPRVKSGSWVAASSNSSATTTIPVMGVLCYLPTSSTSFNITTSDINTSGTVETGLFTSDAPLQQMEITLNNGQDFADKLFIRSDFNATNNGNDRLDLPKFQNESTNFYSVSPDKTQLAVDTRKEWNQIVPLGIKTPAGNYSISIENNTLTVGKSIYLKDNYLNKSTLIKTGTVYNFTVSNDSLSQGDKRFELQFGLASNTLLADESATSGLRLKVIGTVLKGNLLTIEVGGLKASEVGQVTLLDMNGRILKSKAVINGLNKISIDELSNGMQLIKLSNGKDQLVKKFIKD